MVTTLDGHRHGLASGDYVTFTEVQGMVELNDCTPLPIKVKDSFNFEIGDTSKFGSYIRGGIALQKKQSKILKFRTFKEALKEPGETIATDLGKLSRTPQLHLAFATLDEFYSKYKALPTPG